jgi:hypothetical protein
MYYVLLNTSFITLNYNTHKLSKTMILTPDYHGDLLLLGLKPDQSYDKEAVKKAYRRMALKHHPDKNPDSKEGAEATFKMIGAAHAKLNEAIDRGSCHQCPMCGGDHPMSECDQLFSAWDPFGTGSASAGQPAGTARPTSRASPSYTYCHKRGHTEDHSHKKQRDVKIPTCTYCHKRGHLVEDCHIKARNQMMCSYCHKRGHTIDTCFKKRSDLTTCAHCRAHGRPYNHLIENCYHTNPCEICGKTGHSTANCRYRGAPKCMHCGDFGHRVERCFKRHPELIPTCGRCGMKGHTSSRCYQ